MARTVMQAPYNYAQVSDHLPGWDYVDAFECDDDEAGPCAVAAARCLLHPSLMGRQLLLARDLLVRVASLKPALIGGADPFPLQYATKYLAVLGFDDRHLDFRVLVALAPGRVRCTTAVRRHNRLGRAYFAVVGPLHRRIMPHLLARSARRGWRPPRSGQPRRETIQPSSEEGGRG